MNKNKIIRLKKFITRCINEEPNGNFCYYNINLKLDINNEEIIKNLQDYVNKKHIKYLFIVDNVEEARPQRTGKEPSFYRPTSYMNIFSKNEFQNNTFIIAFWGKSWGDEWKLNEIMEGMKCFPKYSNIIKLEEN